MAFCPGECGKYGRKYERKHQQYANGEDGHFARRRVHAQPEESIDRYDEQNHNHQRDESGNKGLHAIFSIINDPFIIRLRLRLLKTAPKDINQQLVLRER